MPDGGAIDSYHHEAKFNTKLSLRARRITKGWGLNGRAAYMDAVIMEAAQDIEPRLTEQEWSVFNWMMADDDKRNQTELANALSLTKGGLSKVRKRIADMFRQWCAERGKI
jgi:hypothetical protein